MPRGDRAASSNDDDFGSRWPARVRAMWAAGALQHLMQALWELGTTVPSSRDRRWFWALVARDGIALLVGPSSPSAMRRATAVTLVTEAGAVVVVAHSEDAAGTGRRVLSRLSWGVAWEAAIAWPALPAATIGSLPLVVGALEHAAGGSRWRSGWREPARDALDSVMVGWTIRTGRDVFLRRSAAMADEAIYAIRLRAERARHDGVDHARRMQYLAWHQEVLTTIADVRLRCEMLAETDGRCAAVAAQAVDVEAELRGWFYQLALGDEGVAIAGVLERLKSERLRHGRLTLVRSDVDISTTGVPAESAEALRVAAEVLMDVPWPIEIGMARAGDRLAIRVTTSGPMLPTMSGFHPVPELDGASAELIVGTA